MKIKNSLNIKDQLKNTTVETTRTKFLALVLLITKEDLSFRELSIHSSALDKMPMVPSCATLRTETLLTTNLTTRKVSETNSIDNKLRVKLGSLRKMRMPLEFNSSRKLRRKLRDMISRSGTRSSLRT
jgi:hypothetical protein